MNIPVNALIMYNEFFFFHSSMHFNLIYEFYIIDYEDQIFFHSILPKIYYEVFMIVKYREKLPI